MSEQTDFGAHVNEFARVIKPGGKLVLSIPKKTAFIYHGCDFTTGKDGGKYALIKKDPFKIRNGVILKIFEDEHDIERHFSSHFGNFVHGSIHDDCFGFDYHWHLVVCERKGA